MAKISSKKGRPIRPKAKPPAAFDLRKLLTEDRAVAKAAAELEFGKACGRIRSLLVQFESNDVLFALNVSDLWPANVSSQVKHQLAFAVYLSIPQVDFSATTLNSYEKFAEFSSSLIQALPQFPSLEDYWPEADWGDIQFIDGIEAKPYFYGGTVQRISDFIEAFGILYGDESEAMRDMRFARHMQATILERVPRPTEGPPEDFSSGHIEVAPKWFWEAMQLALPIQAPPHLTNALLATPGESAKWQTAEDFGDAVMSGQVIPWIGVRIGQSVVPLSLRNTPAAVLDYWSDQGKVVTHEASARFSDFLAKRINAHSLFEGPMCVTSRREQARRELTSFLIGNERHSIVLFCDADELPRIDKPIAEIRRVIRESSDWGLARPKPLSGLQLCDQEGKTPSVDSIDFIVVVCRVTTKLVRLKLPKKADFQIVPLVDAITLFDAMNDLDELQRFWKYEAESRRLVGGISDLVDMFGSFRDSHGQLIPGAIVPTMIMLDAHWGANWRYTQLREFWACAPRNFPDNVSAWNTRECRENSSLRQVTARNAPRRAWSCLLGGCTVHFVLDVDLVGLQVEDGRILETVVHCAADCLAERQALVESILTLPYKRVVVDCVSRTDLLATVERDVVEVASAAPLLQGWQAIDDQPTEALHLRLVVNIARAFHRLQQVSDASFEDECAMSLVDVFSEHVRGSQLDEAERGAFASSAGHLPRFVMRAFQRTVDVPDFAESDTPPQESYKLARRRLAELLMAQGVAPGRYELGEAKALINAARVGYRDMVHGRLRSFDSVTLVRYLIKQLDISSAKYERTLMQHRESLAHEVEYDREESQAEANKQFTRNSRNLRYAIEAALFLTEAQARPARPAEVLEVLGMIDWLLVLYHASDVLHNEVEVGGLIVDDQFVPEVFFSELRESQQNEFAREMAALRLGKDVAEEDKLEKPISDEKFLVALDTAFKGDVVTCPPPAVPS